jgi:hypothetical protein
LFIRFGVRRESETKKQKANRVRWIRMFRPGPESGILKKDPITTTSQEANGNRAKAPANKNNMAEKMERRLGD